MNITRPSFFDDQEGTPMTNLAAPAPARLILWSLDTDQGNRPFRAVRDQFRDWLNANNVDPGDVVDESTVHVILADDLVQLVTWRPDREVDGTPVSCPSCQHCVRGRERVVPLIAPIPSPVAAIGWRDVDAPDDWLTHVNSRATTQGTPPPAPVDEQAGPDA